MRQRVNVRVLTKKEEVRSLDSLSLEFSEESRNTHLGYFLEKRDRLWEAAFTSKGTHGLFAAERDGVAVGYLFCSISTYVVGHARVAAVISLYVGKSERRRLGGGEAAMRLMKLFIEWSKQRKADDIQVHVTTGLEVDRSDKFFRRIGFEPTGRNYAMRLSYDESEH